MRAYALEIGLDADAIVTEFLEKLRESEIEAAARLAGYADAANAGVGGRESNEAAAHARAVQLARAALGETAFDRLHAEGAVLRDADIEALALGEARAL